MRLGELAELVELGMEAEGDRMERWIVAGRCEMGRG